MSNKLHIEIDFADGELDNAIPALIFLANELIEAGCILLTTPARWTERESADYHLRWRFSEWGDNEPPIVLNAEIVDELSRVLSAIEARGTGKLETDNAVVRLRSELDVYLSDERAGLLAEAW